MRISELSDVTGVSVATIKYYLREELVPPGERTAPNQADYSGCTCVGCVWSGPCGRSASSASRRSVA